MSRHPKRILMILAPCLALILSLAIAKPLLTTRAAGASVKLSKTSGPPTSLIKVSGAGFGASETVSMALDTVSLGTATTDGTGALRTQITIPGSTVPGDHLFLVTGQTSGFSASALFLVQTSWASYGFNSSHTSLNPYENVLSTSNVSNLVLKWSQQSLTSRFTTAPTIAGGVVYVGAFDGDNHLYAFNETTGVTYWTAATGNGIASTLAVANGLVYVSSRDDTLYAFNANTGAKVWTATTGNWNYDSPTVVNGIVYFGSSDGNLYALNAKTGSLIWSTAVGGVIEGSSPVVAYGNVYVGARDGGLHAFNAKTGVPVWTTAVGNDGGQSPAVANGIVYIGSPDHNLYAVNARTGKVLWTAATGDVIGDTPAIANGTVYIGSNDGNLYAFNAATGTLLWNIITGSAVTSPAIANGVVYFTSINGEVYAANAAGCGSSSCTPLWSYSTGDMYPSSSAIADGILYTTFTQLYAFHLPSGCCHRG